MYIFGEVAEWGFGILFEEILRPTFLYLFIHFIIIVPVDIACVLIFNKRLGH